VIGQACAAKNNGRVISCFPRNVDHHYDYYYYHYATTAVTAAADFESARYTASRFITQSMTSTVKSACGRECSALGPAFSLFTGTRDADKHLIHILLDDTSHPPREEWRKKPDFLLVLRLTDKISMTGRGAWNGSRLARKKKIIDQFLHYFVNNNFYVLRNMKLHVWGNLWWLRLHLVLIFLTRHSVIKFPDYVIIDIDLEFICGRSQ